VPFSDLIDPLSQDMPKIRDALNTRYCAFTVPPLGANAGVATPVSECVAVFPCS